MRTVKRSSYAEGRLKIYNTVFQTAFCFLTPKQSCNPETACVAGARYTEGRLKNSCSVIPVQAGIFFDIRQFLEKQRLLQSNKIPASTLSEHKRGNDGGL